MQPAAPAPEGDRGGAVAAARHRLPRVDGPRGGRRGQGRRLHRRRHRRVHRRRRPAARLLLPGDEHPAAGRAPGHRADHRPRPRRAADPDRGGGAAAARPERRLASTGTRSRPGSTPRTPPAGSSRRPGTVLGLVEPSGPGIRVDSSLARRHRRRHRLRPDAGQGHRLGAGPGRPPAPGSSARSGTPPSSGVTTNAAFLRALLDDPDVVAGKLDTGLIERRGEELTAPEPPPPHVYAAAALALLIETEPAGPVVDRWDVPDGWRLGEPAWTVRRLQAAGGDPVTVRVRGRSAAAEVARRRRRAGARPRLPRRRPADRDPRRADHVLLPRSTRAARSGWPPTDAWRRCASTSG